MKALEPAPAKPPALALGVQWLVIVLLVLSASFETVLNYIGITLSVFASLTVAGLIVLRIREPNLTRPFRCPGYPVTPLLFLLVNAWMIFYLGAQNHKALIASAVTISVGLVLYFVIAKKPAIKL